MEAVVGELPLEVAAGLRLRLGEEDGARRHDIEARVAPHGAPDVHSKRCVTIRPHDHVDTRGAQLLPGLGLVAAAVAAAAAWTSGAPLEAPRTEVAAATLRGEIVVAGGFVATGGNSRRVDAYAPSTDTWRRLPDLPDSVDHAAAASWHGRVDVIGGYGADRAPLRAAYLFDGSRWRALPRPPEERAAAAAAATAAGVVYVVGGRTGDGLARDMLALDLRTLHWTSLPGPVPREHLAAAALRGRIYAIGGRRAGYDTNLALVQAYDPKQRLWRTLPRLLSPRGGAGAAAIAGRIVSVGGEEPAEFHRQSALMAAAWPHLARAPIAVPGKHHFDVVEQIGHHGTPVFDAVLRLAQTR